MFSSHVHKFALLLTAALASSSIAIADEGMWLFNRPPVKQIKQKYGVDLNAHWFEHVQQSAVRIGSGGSGSLVSPEGLVMTNHHVASDSIEKLSTAENDLLTNGFFARTREEELKCQDLEVNILMSIEDVTERVNGAVTKEMSSAQAGDARRKLITTIEAEAKEKSGGLKPQVVTLYQGARYHLYLFKKYTDVRLVMAPEKGAAFFGGDPDNFMFPRFNLDVTFFRIYENGAPIRNQHYLKWSKSGCADGEPVFVAGHPGRTERLNTVDHLRYMRDFQYPWSLRNTWRTEVRLGTFSGYGDEFRRIAEGDLFGTQNSRKARTGVYAGLVDPVIMNAKLAAETKLRAAVDGNAEWKAAWGDGWTLIKQAKDTQRTFAVRQTALASLGGGLFPKARDLVRLADERTKPNAERLREYTDAALDSLKLQITSSAPLYKALEIEKLESGLTLLVELLGGEDPTVVLALGGKSPRQRAEELVGATTLFDVSARERLFDGGKAAIDASADPLIQLAKQLDPEARALRKRFEDEVDALEKQGYAKVAAANFAVHGEDQYPDATFTLRLAYGTVKGYQQNGIDIAPFTTLAGIYTRAEERGNVYPFELPKRWVEKRAALNPKTPFNFVSTCDIIGGNSGSPTINKDGEVVGLIFDGNIQSLVLNIAYEERQARAVSVDSRAIIEALRKIYDMGALADEIVGVGN